MAVTKLLMLHRRHARPILDRLHATPPEGPAPSMQPGTGPGAPLRTQDGPSAQPVSKRLGRQPQDLKAGLGEEVRELPNELEVYLLHVIGQILPRHQTGMLAGGTDRPADEALRCTLPHEAVVLHAGQQLHLIPALVLERFRRLRTRYHDAANRGQLAGRMTRLIAVRLPELLR